VQEKTPPGTPAKEGQTTGDCRRAICGPGGDLIARDDPADTPEDDGNPCTREACVDGQPGHPAARAGRSCGQGGACDGAGRCVGLVEIQSGRHHSCVRLADSSVKCWGLNDHGQLGRGTDDIVQSSPAPVGGLSRATQLALGGNHSCALLAGGQVACWGANENGQLGDGTTADHSSPELVGGLPPATAIAAGTGFTCALTAASQVHCWGANQSGQLARPRVTHSSAPGEIKELRGATQLSLGGAHGCALLADRTARCWGDNAHGQLGDGTRKLPGRPVAVKGLTTAVELAAGRHHSCARLADGQIRCWGWNNDAQLGEPASAPDRPTPTPVAEVSGALALVAGNSHNCALQAGGKITCWGWNGDAQFGDGDVGAAPRLVANLAPVAQLALGSRHTCARLAAGGFTCWGHNGHGQLGAAPEPP
jgi:alpha-tubulin suppressor-like RCC1 family protein